VSSKSHIIVTEKGKAWLKIILSIPYPKRAWVDYLKNVIVVDDEDLL